MKRKDLKKAIKEYSDEVKFYKLGLVRRLVQLKEKRYNYLLSRIPKVVCPHCGSHLVEVTSSDSEYDDDKWLYCTTCGESFDDTFGLIDTMEDLALEPYFDTIQLELSFNFNIEDSIYDNSIKFDSDWQAYCEEAIRSMLAQGLLVDF